MSLELAAQHLASRGRKGDTMLVHMAPEEVSGLQALAKAGGGTLTLNPDTGLPEANFLKRMLPTLIGAALTPLTGGLINPMTAGLLVGGVQTARTGSLGKGLMAGLGAYGGAGLASSLMGAGTGALSSTAGAAGANSVTPAVADAGVQSVVPELASQGAGVTVTPLGAEAANLSQTGKNLFGGGSYFGPGQGAEAMSIGTPIQTATAMPPPMPTATPYPTALSQNAADIGNVYAQEQAAQNAVANRLATATPMGTLKAGLSEVGKNPSRFMTAGNLRSGLAALSPMMMGEEPEQYKGSGPNPFRYRYEQTMPEGPNTEGSSEALQYQGRYVPYAAGGPIEEMSDRNEMETMMTNGGQMFAAGGQVNLQGTFTAGDQGGNPFGQANANGYQAAGSGGPIQGFSSSFGQMGSGGNSNQLFSGGFGTPGGIDPRAVQADPQGFQRWMKMAQQREQQMPGSTMLGRPQGGLDKSHVIGPGHPMYGRTGATTPEELARMAASIAPQEQLLSDYKSQLQKPIIDAIHKAPAAPPSDNTLVGMGGTAESGFKSPGGISGQLGGFRSMPVGFFAEGGLSALAQGGPSHLGDYSDGGRLLKGPGDGVSDSIPATIANKRPARLADGEFVVPARIVSELGNGSTEAGARKLYAMMDRVQKARKKSIGKNKVAVNSRAAKLLPA